jgi:hypothetical protein
MIYNMIWYDMIYLTSIGLAPGDSSTSHIYTQTVRIIQRMENWEVRAVPRLCELYPGICLTTEEKALENLSYGSPNNKSLSIIVITWNITRSVHLIHNYSSKQLVRIVTTVL